MKGKDNTIFWLLCAISFLAGIKLYHSNFDEYGNVITFLSIMIGFKITSFSILFNSVLKKTLYDRKIKKYGTELHRLKDYYKHALFFETISVLLFFIIPDNITTIIIKGNTLILGRYLLVLPVLIGVFYCFYKILNDMLHIFVYPTND